MTFDYLKLYTRFTLWEQSKQLIGELIMKVLFLTSILLSVSVDNKENTGELVKPELTKEQLLKREISRCKLDYKGDKDAEYQCIKYAHKIHG